MNDLDSQLSMRLHDLAGPEPTSAPPVATLLRRGRQARRRRRAVTTLIAMLAAFALGGAAVVVANPAPAPRDGATAGTEPTGEKTGGPTGETTGETPALSLVAAIAASQNLSYKIKINIAVRKVPGRQLSEEDQRIWEYVGEKGHDVIGAFDPETATGFKKAPGFSEDRLINGVWYMSEKDSRFTRAEGTRRTIHWGDPLTVSAGDADPARTLDILRDQGTTTRTGTRTWHFHLDVPVSKQFPMGQVIDGDLTVGDDDRVRQIRYEPSYPKDARDPRGVPVPQNGVQHVITIDLFDYGTPVVVQVPPTS